MNADERRSESFDYNATIKAMKEMGYIPPGTTSWSINSGNAFSRPTITITANASNSLLEWLKTQDRFDRRIEIVDRDSQEVISLSEANHAFRMPHSEPTPIDNFAAPTRDGLPDRDFPDTMPSGEITWSTLKYYDARVIEWLGWAAMTLSVTGVMLNNYRLWPCFIFWILSNGMSAWIHHRAGPRSLMVRDLIFLALACVGLWQWTR